MKTTTWQTTFGALIAVSACAAASAALIGNLAARVLIVQETVPPTMTPLESSPQPESQGPDEQWRQDIIRSLDDQLRNMKDLERNANQSKDTSLLSDIQNFRSSVDGHKSCVQNASTNEALQVCNDAIQSTGDASSKLWTKSDIANRQQQLKDMERQIKDAEREKIDTSKAKSVLEQYRTALGNVQSLLQSGADNRDAQDAMQDTVQPLQQQFYDVINATRRQGEAARFRSGQLKDMEREITNIERGKGDATKLKEILERVKAALSAAEQLLLSDTTDNRDIDDAFRAVYDTAQEFSALQSAAGRTRELKDREKDIQNMEKELKRAKGANVEKLRQALDEYKAAVAELRKLVESAADPQEINDAFQNFYERNDQQKFWDVQNAANREKELKDRERDVKNMEREVKRMGRQKGVNVQEPKGMLDTYKSEIIELKRLIENGADPETINEAFQDFYERNTNDQFWGMVNAFNMKNELRQWTRKGGHLAKMQKIVDALQKKGKDVGAAASALQEIRSVIANLEDSMDRETLDEGRQEIEDLRMQFEEAIRPYMKKKMPGFPFPMKKG
ncbi:hypothetical protein A3H22_00675 [Candidatus Peribacteria bacterium RIFCSPLOWO2_12_FULL_55_15]|nr:MAG: hypothetical protein A2789_02775 [Candidatus Peribacteria bacterium RIFCSPHIGHO2_01_FULL_54_22]OGJ62556.1 MAG: hypothetical protein A3D12_02505 [Candidatus Peribacteria bacterium RIFCSPHIGHO2_02_FULL_55_24]OGJ63713.1 MAG: hypothetical protein A3E47_01510 [Candidatus Peribacteria bacterium RIFCSPHIGHO2_12_FULL_54_10]OGJ69677.1 MAG: hypothetical protein A3H90_01230 [Candidatus Peribacteria bacterium RIFCSPLOWO2_02_FULL_55_36]OGJ70399.1 MAG: hypothetical protein A3H22_00675 [Candidatus Per